MEEETIVMHGVVNRIEPESYVARSCRGLIQKMRVKSLRIGCFASDGHIGKDFAFICSPERCPKIGDEIEIAYAWRIVNDHEVSNETTTAEETPESMDMSAAKTINPT